VVFWLPIDYAIPRGLAICVLAYLDGSGDTEKGRDAQEYVALASIAAYKSNWESGFEGAWDELVAINGGNPIHAAELHRSGAVELLGQAVGVVASLQRPAFHLFGCVVNLPDYAKALSLCPALSQPPHDDRPKPPEAICVDWCVGDLFDRVEIDYAKPEPVDIGLVFDRNEEFCHWIYRVWTAKYPIRPWWARKRVRDDDWDRPRIATIVPGDSDSYRELQAADVIAWVHKRHHTHGDRDDWYGTLTDGRTADFKYYNLKRLMVKYAPDRQTIDGNVNDVGDGA
jgi:hypothetical protein